MLFIAAVFVLGLLIGSFLNVVIHRLPIMLERQWRRQCEELAASGASVAGGGEAAVAEARYDLVQPRSACPSCGKQISALQNIPIVSWLALRGRCANCKTRISARYPLVEALTGALSAAVAWKFGYGWEAAAGLVLTWFLVALAFIDFDTQLLPDALTLPLLWLGLIASLFAATLATTHVIVAPRTAILGAVAGYLSLWAVYHLFRLVTGKEGMGYGDFKLYAALGAWLGWQMLLPIILFSAAVGALTGIALIVLQGRDRATPIPFGPFLAAAGWLALMGGPEIVSGYLGYFGAGR